MRENFDKIKKIELRRAKLLSLAFGVCCGLAAAGVFLLAFKLGAVQLGWYIYVIIGACAAAVSCAAFYYALIKGLDSEKSEKKPSKRRLTPEAKKQFRHRVYDIISAAVIFAVVVSALVYYAGFFEPNTDAGAALRGVYIILFAILAALSAALLGCEIGRAHAAFGEGRTRKKKQKSDIDAYDLKLAKKLDKEYSLGEKAQTLIEFEGQNGAMLSLQRESAEAAIGAITLKKPSAKRVAQAAAVVIICLALFISGVAVKQRVKETVVPVDEQPYEMTDAQLITLNTMIENVNGDTAMDAALRQNCVTALNNLMTYLTGGGATNGGMVTEVQTAMIKISTYTFETNTYDDYITAFDDVDGGKPFAWAIYESAICYKTAANINSYDTVLTRSRSIDDDIEDIMQSYIDDIIEVTDATEFATNLETTITTYKQILDGAAEAVDVSTDDALYSAVETLRTEFLKYYNRINGGYTIDAFHTGLASALNTFSRNSSTALRAQVYNCMMDEYMRQSLSDIFGVAVQGLDNPEPMDEDSGSSGDGSVNAGGAGSGETLYGSDDYVYDPNTGEYVQYGELLNAETNGYLSRLYAMLDSEDISEDTKSYIQAYINKLLGTGGSD